MITVNLQDKIKNILVDKKYFDNNLHIRPENNDDKLIKICYLDA